jgi:hypothetical protein
MTTYREQDRREASKIDAAFPISHRKIHVYGLALPRLASADQLDESTIWQE